MVEPYECGKKKLQPLIYDKQKWHCLSKDRDLRRAGLVASQRLWYTNVNGYGTTCGKRSVRQPSPCWERAGFFH